MGVVSNEPSMEDILSSIKRIIADGSDRAAPARSMRRKAPERYEQDRYDDERSAAIEDEGSSFAMRHADEEPLAQDSGDSEPAILELTDMVEESTPMNDATAAPRKAAQKAPAPAAAQPTARKEVARQDLDSQDAGMEDVILSDLSTQAARQSLSQLSSMLVRPQEGEANTLDGLVREMLRPMLKEWLDSRLPDLVQAMVKKEIDRIVGRLG